MSAYRGIIMLTAAELCFAAATVFAKFITNQSDISAIEITFFRFFFGIGISYWALKKTGYSFKPQKKTFVIWRGILNTFAVILFFSAVKYSTITNANMLNMTYPVFIFLFAAFFGFEKITISKIVYLVLSIMGIYLIIQPKFDHILMGDLLGLASGIVGGVSVLTLRKARETESTFLILFYLMTIGTLINGAFMIPIFKVPTLLQALLISASALLGVAGQAFITYGYKYIEASKGSIISSSRIIFAVLMGIIIFDERLNIRLIIGAILILYTVTSLTWMEGKTDKKEIKY
jgi:drug/metabolite transporter (DMT)-like permease